MSFLIFTCIYIVFLFRVRMLKPDVWTLDREKPWYRDWRTLAGALFVSCAGILVRDNVSSVSSWDNTSTSSRFVQSTVPSSYLRDLTALLLPTKHYFTDSIHYHYSFVLSSMSHVGQAGSFRLRLRPWTRRRFPGRRQARDHVYRSQQQQHCIICLTNVILKLQLG
jgi:hypothetical protein